MSSPVDRAEIIAGIQRRRRFSADQKLAVVQEAAQPGMTMSNVGCRRGIAPSLVFGWRRRMTEGGKVPIRAGDAVIARAGAHRRRGRFHFAGLGDGGSAALFSTPCPASLPSISNNAGTAARARF